MPWVYPAPLGKMLGNKQRPALRVVLKLVALQESLPLGYYLLFYLHFALCLLLYPLLLLFHGIVEVGFQLSEPVECLLRRAGTSHMPVP